MAELTLPARVALQVEKMEQWEATWGQPMDFCPSALHDLRPDIVCPICGGEGIMPKRLADIYRGEAAPQAEEG